MDALDVKAGDRVFHLGCGVGYYTAILAEMAGAAGHLVASEVDAALAARAQANLADYPSVEVHAADGAAVETGPCDAMLINAGVTHPHAQWLDALTEGGRLVLPLTSAMPQSPDLGRGAMMKIERNGKAFSAQMVTYAAIFSCTSVRDAEMNVAIGKALAGGALAKVRSLRRDAHEKTDSCLLHGDGICWSSASV
jgi:protein-L-isoaspartate(D-aspartate) O-methyltransferase